MFQTFLGTLVGIKGLVCEPQQFRQSHGVYAFKEGYTLSSANFR